jgi:serine/threonine-protein kinase
MKLRLHVSTLPKAPFEHRGASVCMGRAPQCELRLGGEENEVVSWKHARIDLTTKAAYLIDLGSSNGTFLNDRRVDGRAVVKAGDQIRLGLQGPKVQVLLLDLSGVAAPGLPPPPRPEPAGLRLPPLPGLPESAARDKDAGPSDEAAKTPRDSRRTTVDLRRLARRRQLAVWGGGAAAACLVVGLLAVWLWPREQPTGRTEARAEETKRPAEEKRPSGRQAPPVKEETEHPNDLPKDPPKDDTEEQPREDLPAPKPPEAKKPAPKSRHAEPAPGRNQPPGLAGQARKVFETYCYRCHGKNGSKKGKINYIVDLKQLVAKEIVVPGKPAESVLYAKLTDAMDPMPPEGETPRPGKAEIEVVRRWIEGGAPADAGGSEPKKTAEKFVSERDVLVAIRDHLRKTEALSRKFQRYYTLTHFFNNPERRDQLPLYRAALAKLLNSLSWKAAIVLPQAVDPGQTVFAVDLRDLDWDGSLWNAVVRAYPYGLRHDRDADESLRDLAAEVYELAETRLPAVRADWLIANASRPPLYHILLRLPRNAQNLEAMLGVNIERNFERGRLVRAGFTKSGVSTNNRMIERHEAKYGAYWKSYDFKSSKGRSNLVKFPLGPGAPVFRNPQFRDQAFQHAGGEVIFNLPNGLQAYLLVNNQDQRIDEGPVEIVRDKSESSGAVTIVNGVSCMACHKRGMINEGFKEVVRDSAVGLPGPALIKVQQLYPPKGVIEKFLERDEKRFTDTVKEVVGPFLKDPFTTEPISSVAKPYRRGEVGPLDAALELGLENPKELQEAIRKNRLLQGLGLLPLVQGDSIKREVWEGPPTKRITSKLSVFQIVARELGLGEPLLVMPVRGGRR